MMTRDDVVLTKNILHHLAKFQISWASFTVILGNFQKLEQDENFLEQDMRTVRTTFKMVMLRVRHVPRILGQGA